MPRPIWKGHVSFGLVNIPVTLYTAEKRDGLSFKLIDKRNNAGIKYRKVNEVTNEEVSSENIVKAYPLEGGEFVALTDADLRRAAPESTQSVDIEMFVPAEQIPIEYFERPYYLVPDKKGERPYALLRAALKKANCVGIAKVVISTKQYLAALMVRDRALILELLRFSHELREVPEEELPTDNLEELKVTDKELALADQLVDSMRGEFVPTDFKDEYKEKVIAYIEAKVKGGETFAKAAPEDEDEDIGGEGVIDMMALLRKSMEQQQRASAAKKGKASA
jgi:DNA end-binding protein Ku